MSEDKPVYNVDKMQRIDADTHAAIGELVTLFAGLPGVTRQKVVTAALNCLRWYIHATQAQGWSMERIWRDVTKDNDK